MRLTRLLIVVSFLIIGGMLASCGGEAAPEPSPAAISPTSAPTAAPSATPPPTPLPTESPTAEPTLVPASVSGRVLWGSQPVAQASVSLHLAVDDTPIASTQAGAAGQFLLAAVPPDNYSLEVAWPDGTANQSQPLQLELEPGQAISDLTLALEQPLSLVEPSLDQDVATLPSISWEPIADSALYRVTIRAADAAEPLIDVQVAGNVLDVADQLDVSQSYTLAITALDADGAPLASFTGDMQTQAEPSPPRAVVLPPGCSQVGLPTYINMQQGVCFAFPQDHAMTSDEASPNATSPDALLPTIAGPPVGAGAILFPNLTVEALPADGLELSAWVDAYLAGLTDDPSEISRVPTMVAGVAAEIMEPIPGDLRSRQVAIASGANILLLTFSPTFRDVPAEEQDFLQRRAQTAADNLFETVMATLGFLSSSGSDVTGGIQLPAACIVDGAGLNVDADSGLCLAIPTGFTAQRTPDGLPRLIGPALDAGLSPIRATFALQPTEAANGRTLEDIVTDYVGSDGGEETTQTEIMLAGEPALLIEKLPAGRGSQEIFVLRGDQVYHLVFQPDPAAVTLAEADMQRLMDAVISSFSFLADED